MTPDAVLDAPKAALRPSRPPSWFVAGTHAWLLRDSTASTKRNVPLGVTVDRERRRDRCHLATTSQAGYKSSTDGQPLAS